jgi:hypothetical protein
MWRLGVPSGGLDYRPSAPRMSAVMPQPWLAFATARLPWRLVLAEMRAPTFLDSSETPHRHRNRPRRDEHPDDHEELGPRDLRTTKPRPHCWGPGRFDRHLQPIYSKLGACSLSQAAASAWAAVGVEHPAEAQQADG